MPIATKRLHIGKSYRIDVVADAQTPEVSLVIRGWIPKSGAATPPAPLALLAGPGDGDRDQGTVPVCHALELEWEVLESPTTKLKIVVTEGGQSVVDLPVTTDGWLTVLVKP